VLASPAFGSCLQAELVARPEVADVLPQVAVIKRFVEWWLADDALRDSFETDTPGVAARHGVPEELASYLHRNEPLGEAAHPALRAYGLYLEQRLAHRERMRGECAPDHPGFRAWRERQMRRCQGQLPPHYNQAILHLPVAFELSQGCSVGCWFCGLSAARLESVFSASEENRTLWRECLEVISQVCGPSAGRGIAFWATDPLDNPDYELLCQDFHTILGRFPATTTALGARDLERTERLLGLSWEHGCEFNRFSILSTGQMKRLTEHFSPEALLYVDLIAQTRGALRAKALAGKALGSEKTPSAVSSEPSTIACVSGFLVNMPAREVRLISPCEASQRWPMGYRVHAIARFARASELRDAIDQMLKEHAGAELFGRPRLGLRPDVMVAEGEGSVVLSAPYGPSRRFSLTPLAVRRLREGQSQAAELALELEGQGVSMAETFHTFRRLLEEGWLDDEPERTAHD
jgi:radical SAM family RiPP maturation amino acid epimerase